MHDLIACLFILLFVAACAGNVIQASRHLLRENMALAQFAFNGLCIVGIAYLAWG